jgi:hypothetical protein
MRPLKQKMNQLDKKTRNFQQEFSMKTRQVVLSETIQFKSYPEHYSISIERGGGSSFGLNSMHFTSMNC